MIEIESATVYYKSKLIYHRYNQNLYLRNLMVELILYAFRIKHKISDDDVSELLTYRKTLLIL